jgi:hypothetical protein
MNHQVFDESSILYHSNIVRVWQKKMSSDDVTSSLKDDLGGVFPTYTFITN